MTHSADVDSSTSSAKKKPKNTRRWVIIGAVIITVIALIALFFRPSGSAGAMIPETDLLEVTSRDITTSVPVTGQVQSAQTVDVFTNLSAPVAELPVQVGDHVQLDQVVARLDATQLERQLASEQASQASADASAQDSVAQAQQSYDQLLERLAQGLHPELQAAESAVTSAEASLRQAQAAVETARKSQADARSEEVKAAEEKLNAARNQVESAARNTVRAQYGAMLPGDETLGPSLPIMDLSDAEAAEAEAHHALARAEAEYQQALADSNQASVAEAQATEAGAYQSYLEAQRSLAATQLSLRQQVESAATAIDSAARSAAAAHDASQTTINQLRVDQNSTTITAPLTGIVAEVSAQVGAPASGKILTIADDTRLVIKGNIEEDDVSGINTGQKVTFTTPTTGTKEFTGRVHSISPIAVAAAPEGDGPSSNAVGKISFPIEIIVEGNNDDLRIGTTAKAKIVLEEARGVTTVPGEAVLIDADGNASVLTIQDNILTEVPVTLGLRDATTVAITAQEGDLPEQVVDKAATYRESIGMPVVVGP